MDPMDLIDRYIAEVGKDLPRKNRLDIEAEILAALEDMLHERSQKTGKPMNEQMVVEVLKEYGAPRKVAVSYQPERYVIGPRLFPSFLTVIQFLLPVIAAIALVKMGISLGQVALTFDNIFEAVFLGVAEFLGSAFTALGSLMVLFAIVQWALPEFKDTTGAWDPYKLPSATPRNRVETGSTLLGIFASLFAIVIFNFFPHWINISYHVSGQWWVGFAPLGLESTKNATLLSSAFFNYLPAMNILWVLNILLDVALLSRSRWENWSRWCAFGLTIVTIALAGVMLAGPALVLINAEELLALVSRTPLLPACWPTSLNKAPSWSWPSSCLPISPRPSG